MSIALEALGRVIAPPEISNPKIIVIIGSLGLLSNIVGLFLFHGESAYFVSRHEADQQNTVTHMAILMGAELSSCPTMRLLSKVEIL
jgi:Co/Zn/Cd efflux system component